MKKRAEDERFRQRREFNHGFTLERTMKEIKRVRKKLEQAQDDPAGDEIVEPTVPDDATSKAKGPMPTDSECGCLN
jgi:hypothetical protein